MLLERHSLNGTIGICPQDNVLYDLLTVDEHMKMFCDIKGIAQNTDQISQLITELELTDYRNTLSTNLSGGNKRKLQIAIALLQNKQSTGEQSLLLLDEPTAGLDLTARRKLWHVLAKAKKDRVVILTTHYMDEADVLGDRIGIMSRGKIVCLGSSMFLKSKFGVGINLTILKEKLFDKPQSSRIKAQW